MARLSPRSLKSQVQLDDAYLIALAKQGSPDAYDRLVRRYYGVRAPEGVVVLPRRRRQRRPRSRRAWSASTRRSATSAPTASRRSATSRSCASRARSSPRSRRPRATSTRRSTATCRSPPRRRRDATPSRRSTRCCPARPSHDPVNQVICSEELRSLVACLSTVLSELESRVLSLYLDGHSYEAIGERLDCDTKTVDNALQRVKRKVGAHLAVARRAAVTSGSLMPTWLIIVARRPGAARHRRHDRPRARQRKRAAAASSALAQVNRDLAAAAAEDRGWDRERLEAAARRVYAEQRGAEPDRADARRGPRPPGHRGRTSPSHVERGPAAHADPAPAAASGSSRTLESTSPRRGAAAPRLDPTAAPAPGAGLEEAARAAWAQQRP